MRRRRHLLAVVLTTSLLAGMLLSGCTNSRSEDNDGPYMVLGDPRVSGLDDWPGAFNGPMEAYDFDGDGSKEIIAQSTDKKVYVFSSETGRALAVLRTKYPPAWHIDQALNGVQVGVLEPGQPPSLVLANHAGYLSAWRFVPGESDGDAFVFERTWEKRASGCENNPSIDGTAIMVDVDGDERPELFVQSEEVGLYGFSAVDGSQIWKQCWGGGNGSPTVGDLDGDGKMEVVFASDGGFVSVFDAASGDVRWTFDATDEEYGIKPGSVTVSPTIAELDGKPPMEVLFTTRYAPEDDPDAFDDYNLGIFSVHSKPNGYESELHWMIQPEWGNPISYTHLLVHDVEEDGKPDVFGMDWNTIGHRPGDWQRLGPGNAFRLSSEGDVVWVREMDAYWSNKDVALADPDGDGNVELIVNGPGGSGDGLWRLATENGGTRGFHDADGWKLKSGARFFDLEGDGSMHLAYRVTPNEDDTTGAILVHDLDVPFNAVQYEYVVEGPAE